MRSDLEQIAQGKVYYWHYTEARRGKHTSRSFKTLSEAFAYADEKKEYWVQAELIDASNPINRKVFGYIGTSGAWHDGYNGPSIGWSEAKQKVMDRTLPEGVYLSEYTCKTCHHVFGSQYDLNKHQRETGHKGYEFRGA